MATADSILTIARSQIGVTATGQNNVLYNTWYYGRTINASGYAWCAVFIAWVFNQAGASGLYYGGNKTAYCPTLLSYHKGQAVTDYQPGDVIFFNFSGKTNAAHVGICESYDGTNITTIDGNTSSSNEANGGTVARRKRAKSYIVGAYRPAYQTTTTTEEDEIVTQDQFNAMMEVYEATQKAKTVNSYAKDQWTAAQDAGVFDGTAPQGALTREQAAVVESRLGLVGLNDTLPDYAKESYAKMVAKGITGGNNPGNRTINYDLAVMFDRLGLLDD